MGQLLKIYNNQPSPKQLQTILDVLQSDGLIIYPTDTIYAIGCDALNHKATDRLAALKTIDKAELTLLCKDISQLTDYARIDTARFKFLKSYLPGPYTFILPATNHVPKLLASKRKTIGIRIPNNSLTLAIIEALDHPLISSSVPQDDAEPEYHTEPELILERYNNQVDLILDAGTGGNIPSTIIDYSNDTPTLLRQGLGEIETL